MSERDIMSMVNNDCGLYLLTPLELANRLRISQRQIYRLVATDNFPPPIKVGNQNRWRELDISEHLRNLENLSSVTGGIKNGHR